MCFVRFREEISQALDQPFWTFVGVFHHVIILLGHLDMRFCENVQPKVGYFVYAWGFPFVCLRKSSSYFIQVNIFPLLCCYRLVLYFLFLYPFRILVKIFSLLQIFVQKFSISSSEGTCIISFCFFPISL